ncbi:ethylene-insensitive protein 2 [Ipomoea triloba]|uniref:ethylene-insensitive protein 2 n=1 Tax=Ipomoea triloba TaxID=35885 RepID=UPI00125E6D58|nr:ethylene-insensitive protein 2 [Ipomoea triloba]XP_031112910.1 ethylene-insensitive protein 2 [Ipomoea triloba]
MESEALTGDHQTSTYQRFLSAVVPVLFITIGYVDPGKWAAVVEGGGRFGFDLTMVLLLFNLGAILCQYLSARIAVVTGRDLAQICSEEYDKITCIFLGLQAEISIVALELTMVLGTAHGLNVIFGIDLFSCVFLTATNAVLFPLISSLVDNGRAKLLCIGWTSFILLAYVLGVLISQPENPFTIGGMLTKLNGESAFALMSLLGASIMPHNFYLHSSIVQQDQVSKRISKGALCQDHFFAILSVFSGIFLVNYVLLNLAASAFYSTGLVLLTFHEALSLLDQVFGSSMTPFVILLVLLSSNQITALTWDLGKQVVVHDLFGMDLPGWLHHVTVRIIAIVPALYCVWNSGAEGLYQLLIYTQVGVALVLPSAVIPLFRVASSRSIMGIHKISHILELLALGTFFAMLGLKIIFVTEMVFGNSDWVNNLKWNTGSSPYAILLIAASSSLCLMLWLAATPLKSASSRFDPQALHWDIHPPMPEPSLVGDEPDANESISNLGIPMHSQEPALQFDKSFGCRLDLPTPELDSNLPESLLNFERGPQLTTIDENKSEITFASNSTCHPQVTTPTEDADPVSKAHDKVSIGEPTDAETLPAEPFDVVEKTLQIEGDIQNDKDDDRDSWEPEEEATKEISTNNQSLTSDSPGSFKSISGKTDDVGSGTGSLSRLAGLGRAARRQLTTILDEFWGQLFDFHGQATSEAKSNKLDALLGVDSKIDPKPPSGSLKLDSIRKDVNAYLTMGAPGSDSMINSDIYSPRRIGQTGRESPYVGQEPSSWSGQMRMLDAYRQSSNHNSVEIGEKRYSSMRFPASSASFDQQPATIHGYEFASYLNRITKERCGDYVNGQMESPIPKSTAPITSNYVEPYAGGAYRPKPQTISSTRAPPGFANVSVSRNNSLQSGQNLNDLYSTGNGQSAATTKKFYSLPDISGLYVPHRNSSLSQRTAQLDNSMGYGPSVGHTLYAPAHSRASQMAYRPSGFDQLSPSKVCRDAFSLKLNPNPGTGGSLWSTQPFEQFGVDKSVSVGTDSFGAMQSSSTQETLEAKLLQSFRSCILKLLKLEGSDWLFKLDDGADEDLISRVAARERFLYDAETREVNRFSNIVESQSNMKPGSAAKSAEADFTKFLVMSVPHCGEGCVWRVDLIVSFGIWCIHRILELSLMESRPELWGKYTYVLNRLQGIIDLGFFKPHSPMIPCFCLQIPVGQQPRSSMPISNGSLPPPAAKQNRGKCTTAAMLLEMIKDVEIAISCRKGRTGTAAGDVAFPKGKENLASVLKRYKRRLSNKPVASQEGGPGSQKAPSSTALYAL